MGLVDRVHGKDAFLPEVVGFAERVATHPLTVLSASKRMLDAAEDTGPRTGCLLERETPIHINECPYQL